MTHKLSRGRATHSDRLERWLGKEQVEKLSKDFKSFYWPVPVRGVPGKVFVMPGGDFAGEIAAGQFACKHDAAAVTLRKLRNKLDAKRREGAAVTALMDMIAAEDRAAHSVGAFASVNAVIAAATGGKGQLRKFSKTGVAANAIGNANDLWTRAGTPVAGSAAASTTGSALTNATTGALAFADTAGQNHYLNWSLTASVANNSLLLYDRLYSVVKTMNSTAAQAVSTLPSRYQNTTSTADDFIGGNFAFPSNPTTVLAATAHNWASCTYLDEGNAAGTFQTVAGVSACVVGGVDIVAGQWFMPLASGDVGVKALTNIQCSAAVATGTIDFVIGHPIAVNACPIANIACLDDGLYTSLNLAPIMAGACLAFIELPKPATTATTYSGIIRTVAE